MKELIPRTIHEVIELIDKYIFENMNGSDITNIRKVLNIKASEFYILIGVPQRTLSDYVRRPQVCDKMKNILRGAMLIFLISKIEVEYS